METNEYIKTASKTIVLEDEKSDDNQDPFYIRREKEYFFEELENVYEVFIEQNEFQGTQV